MNQQDDLQITFPDIAPNPEAEEKARLIKACLVESLNCIFKEASFLMQAKHDFFAKGGRTRKRRNHFANWIVNRRGLPRKSARRIANAPLPR
jgi:hypothetical protein